VFGDISDTISGGLKAALTEKREQAQQLWVEFDAVRQKAIESKADLRNVETAEFKALEQAHAAYQRVSEEAKSLEERLLAGIEERHAKGAVPAGERKGIVPGIGAAFLRGMGVGAVGSKALDATAGGSAVPAFFDDRIRMLPQRQLFVRSLIPTKTVDSDKVQYLLHTVATNNAAVVAAGALKPTSVYTVSRQETAVKVIAHVAEALDRSLLMDLDQLVDFMDSQLRLGVLLTEEAQILNGTGAGANFRGILNTPGIGSVARNAAGESRADAIYRAITNVRLALYEPEAIVLHPNDWQTLRLEKTADGEYLAGSVIESDPDRLWGKEVITSPVMTQGRALVGAFGAGASIWDREATRVTYAETGLGDNPGEELFTRNLVRFRAEERLAFAVERPPLFCEVTGL
jgi:HK97 family phage major capsid protein